MEWDENDVQAWLTSLGFPQYESRIKGPLSSSVMIVTLFLSIIFFIENNISGEVLCMLDSEGLKDVGVTTIGQRLAILKAVYQVKLAQNVPIDADHYVPPCAFPFHLNQTMALIYYSAEAQDRENLTLDRLYDIVKNQSLS